MPVAAQKFAHRGASTNPCQFVKDGRFGPPIGGLRDLIFS